ncbi:hypothetical protein [Kribbella speibonae]|uniref:Uncharacterized protein n=1 Tax=Kribbella speibonae TaxID=1572660 RepID=A0A4R0IXD8_9ACTN|nr:hypothetical protein [Kribbella speibonae]TCC36326.1 hypothetical protein E0H92_27125 [Kribbella speibonae]
MRVIVIVPPSQKRGETALTTASTRFRAATGLRLTFRIPPPSAHLIASAARTFTTAGDVVPRRREKGLQQALVVPTAVRFIPLNG